jgi:hypothetical protein
MGRACQAGLTVVWAWYGPRMWSRGSPPATAVIPKPVNAGCRSVGRSIGRSDESPSSVKSAWPPAD